MSDGTAKRERPLTIKEERSRSQDSACWENWQSPAIVRFMICATPIRKAYWIGVPFGSVKSLICEEQIDGSCLLGIEWLDNATIRGIQITGSKVEELFTQFCLQVVSAVRAGESDIERVKEAIPKPIEFEGNQATPVDFKSIRGILYLTGPGERMRSRRGM